MIDESIEIDVSKLPKRVRIIIEELEYLAKNDPIGDNYLYKSDELDVVAKSYAAENVISVETYNLLLKKYCFEK